MPPDDLWQRACEGAIDVLVRYRRGGNPETMIQRLVGEPNEPTVWQLGVGKNLEAAVMDMKPVCAERHRLQT